MKVSGTFNELFRARDELLELNDLTKVKITDMGGEKMEKWHFAEFCEECLEECQNNIVYVASRILPKEGDIRIYSDEPWISVIIDIPHVGIFSGISRCGAGDQFDEELGTMLALARALDSIQDYGLAEDVSQFM